MVSNQIGHITNIAVLLIGFIIITIVAIPWANAAETPYLIYTYENDIGNTITDDSRNGHNGMGTKIIKSQVGDSYQYYFDGSTSYIDAMFSPSTSDGDLTIIAWVNASNASMGTEEIAGSYYFKNISNTRGFALALYKDKVYAFIGDSAMHRQELRCPFPSNVMTQVAMTHSNSTGEFNLYINGKLVNTTKINGYNGRSNTNFTIGRYGLSDSYPFQGHIGYVEYSKMVYTAQDIRNNYNQYKSDYIGKQGNTHTGGVAFSFDDQYLKNWTSSEVKDIFNTHDFKGTFYINYPSKITAEDKTLLLQLYNDGHEIGGHGENHEDALVYIAANGETAYINNEISPMMHNVYDLGIPMPKDFSYPHSSRNIATDTLLLNDQFTTVRTDASYVGPIQLYQWDNSRVFYALDVDTNLVNNYSALKQLCYLFLCS